MNEVLKALGMTEEKAISILERLIVEDEDIDFYSLDEKMSFEMAISALKERPKGEWLNQTDFKYQPFKYCSECGFTIWLSDTRQYNFCPNCGCSMKVGNKFPKSCDDIDPNDLTHIFDGVTEIPKDLFNGWYTEKMLEQTRAESEE